MRFFRLLALLLVGASLLGVTGCDSHSDNPATPGTAGVSTNPAGGGPATPPPVGARMVDISVALPSGVNLDLSQASVLSQLAQFAVENGQSQAVLRQDGRSLAILFDANGKPVLIGFIREGQRELSVTSTAEAALFYGLGTVYLPEEIKQKFFDQIRGLPFFTQFVAQTQTLFASDPNFLTSQAFQDLLQATVQSVVANGDLIDIQPRLVFSGDERSGLSLEEQPGDKAILVNTLRRRAYAFIYKVSSKDLNDQETVLIADIAGQNAPAGQEVIVGPTTDISSTIGVLQNQVSGKGLEYARKESDPISLGLAANENEAMYKVRVIGPSAFAAVLTDQEEERLRRLEYETLGLDVALPILVNMVGEDSFLKSFKNEGGDAFVDAFTNLVSSLPAVNDALTQGDLSKARDEFFDALRTGALSNAFQPFYDQLIGFIGDNVDLGEDEANRLKAGSESFFKALDAVDLLLGFADIGRVLAAPTQAAMLEEWNVTSTRNKVTLVPAESTAIQGEEKTLTAVIQDSNLAAGESYEFHWSTSGQFGVLRDSLGHEGTSFTSSSDEVRYFSSNALMIPEGAEETVTVEVFIRQGMNSTRLNQAEGSLKVLPLGFKITPSGLTIDGGSSLALRAVRSDGSDPTSSSAFDYRFAWETDGHFGL
ncbi:MAG: hypothetical protein KC910_28090, partial [Candidatus Eremiobacteraeota bacterium]|nr:hypothetical protein [Candidatus Eremiobacteraeota bacterium]